MIANYEATRDALRVAFAAMKEQANSTSIKLFYEFLGTLAEAYMLDLTTCRPDEFVRYQALLNQCLAMQRSLLPEGELPKI